MAKSFLSIMYVICLFMVADVSTTLMKNNARIGSNLKSALDAPNLNLTDYSYAVVDKCNQETCNPNLGSCGEGMCVCHEEYANFPKEASKSPYPNSACNYERKKVLIAVMLEFFMPFGTSYFYLGYYGTGLLKVSMLLFLPIVLLTVSCNFWRPSHKPVAVRTNSVLCYSLSILFVGTLVTWLLVDILFIVLNKYTDSNGVPLSKTTTHK